MTDSPRKVMHWMAPQSFDRGAFVALACGRTTADLRPGDYVAALYEPGRVTCPECRQWMEERR